MLIPSLAALHTQQTREWETLRAARLQLIRHCQALGLNPNEYVLTEKLMERQRQQTRSIPPAQSALHPKANAHGAMPAESADSTA